eukprot:scaffold41_cov370-Pavlova_lutheri.AAC.1
MLEKFGMDNAKESRVPLSECMKQGKEESDEELVVQYQQLVGQLLYLSTTVRPDIAHAASVLSRYMSKPAQEHWKAAKRVLKYLKGTRTHEAEYMAVSACVKEALWIRNFLGSLMNGTWDGILILNDNQATLRMINDLNSVSRSKHIDIQHHFVRERAVRGEVKFHYCPTDIMLADYLTKILPSSRFEEIRDALHVVKKQE